MPANDFLPSAPTVEMKAVFGDDYPALSTVEMNEVHADDIIQGSPTIHVL